MSASEGLRAADATLAGYQRDLDRAVTGRLHAYLPLTVARRAGRVQDEQPGRRPVRRPDGLPARRRPPGRDADRDPRPHRRRVRADPGGRRPRTRSTRSGETLTRDRVAEAKARFEAPVVVPPTTVDVAGGRGDRPRRAAGASGRTTSVDPATVTDVVLAYDQNLTFPAAVLIESIARERVGTRPAVGPGPRPHRRLPGLARRGLPGAADDVPAVRRDHVRRGAATKPAGCTARITISTMDRLLLPVMLDDVSRLVYLDVDTMMLGDVCALARTDLGGHPVAARDSNVSEDSEWRRAGRSLPEDLAHRSCAADLGHRHGFGHAALNAGVLVMDLDRMRRDDFTDAYLGLGRAVRLPRPGHDAGVRRARTGRSSTPRWNAMPALEDVPDPSLIHWASFGKPWDAPLTFAQDVWWGYAEPLRGPRRASRRRPMRAAEPGGGTGRLDAPIEIGPATTPLAPAIEAVIEGVRAEHLSYLGAANLRTLASTVAGDRGRRDRRADRRVRHGPRRLGDRDGRREGHRPADAGLRRLRDDPAAGREGRRGRPRALRHDRQRRLRPDRRRHLLRLPRRPARRGHGVVRPARRADRGELRRADPGPLRGHHRRSTSRSPSPTSTATGTRRR